MDHELAAKAGVAQKYFLNELSAAERESFEAHFFECRVCADEVRDTAIFIENARVVLRGMPREEERSLWSRIMAPIQTMAWAPTLAAVMFAAIAAYQQFYRIPEFKRGRLPQAAVTTVLAPSSRGEMRVVSLGKSEPVISLQLDVNAPANVERLRLEVRKTGGGEVMAEELSAGPAINLRLPSASAPDGEYQIRILGLPGQVLIHEFEFRVQRQ